jgi:hypothetical protein
VPESMPLNDGYGVLLGTISNYFRDPPDNFGKYYHGNLIIAAPTGSYRCAIDVDSKQSAIGVEWRVVTIQASELTALVALGPGYHALASTSSSGALDYIRSPMFAVRLGCTRLFWRLLGRDLDITSTWKRGTDV